MDDFLAEQGRIADDFTARDQWTEASAIWAQLRRTQPSFAKAYWKGVEIELKQERFEQAFVIADQMAAIEGLGYAGRLYLAELHCRRGQWHEAVAAFEAIKTDFPVRGEQLDRNAHYRTAILNAYGIIEGNRRLSLQTHTRTIAEEADGRHYTFVSGMPRAGTTAMGFLLRSAPGVAMTIEMENPYFAYSPNSFAMERLTQAHSKRPGIINDHVLSIAPTARIIGDKRPLFHYSLPQTLEAMGENTVTVFHMCRNLLDIGLSYDKRAKDPEDHWEPLRNIHRCVHELNVMHQFILDYAERPAKPQHKMIYVDYGKVFRNVAYAVSMFAPFGALITKDPEPAVRAFIEKSQSRERKPNGRRAEIADIMGKGLDLDLVKRVEEYTGVVLWP